MDLTIVNHEYSKEYVIDNYKSIIWNDRYNKCGDFEIYIPMSETSLDVFQNGYYVLSDISEGAMIIENMSITSDEENISFLIVSGRSLESILTRRIIWAQTNIAKNTYVQNAIKSLIDDAIIQPSISERTIPNFEFNMSTDPAITSLKTVNDMQFTGDNLYEAISKICGIYGIGFKVTLNLDRSVTKNGHTYNGVFEFKLYSGKDRSYNQDVLPYVVFSPEFDNLISSDYKIETQEYKNVTLIAGEGEGIDRKTTSLYSDVYSGLNRRELYTDARDLSTNIDGGTLSDEEYIEVLKNRGLSKLQETQVISNFDADAAYNITYEYNKDYFIGDIVQFENRLGLMYPVRVIESIYSESTDGIKYYPIFEILEED